jgi:hypothetical protein
VTRKIFEPAEVIKALVADINQQSVSAERIIDRDALASWASSGAPDPYPPHFPFDAHAIYYDEEDAEHYGGDGPPLEENAYQPFLSHGVAIRLVLGVLAG